MLSRSIFDLEPHKGRTLTEEMQCYSLPYGALGFVSHLLTYYTVSVLSAGRSPIRPWRKLYNSRLNLWLSAFGLIGGFSLAVFTLVRCRNHWQLLVIGIWKLSMSFFNGVVGVHVALIMRKVPKPAKKEASRDAVSPSSYLPLIDEEKASQKSGVSSFGGSSYHEAITQKEEEKADVERPTTLYVWAWVLLYFPGMLAGFAGLVSLIIQNWRGHNVLHIITYVFSGFIALTVLGVVLAGGGGMLPAAFFFFTVFASLAALYGDWALGAMVGNLLGTPSGDSGTLYWSYFLLKRLTMFST